MDRIDSMTLSRMYHRGDSFAERLADACAFATDAQLAAIKHALPEVFEKYRPPGIATPPKIESTVQP